MDKWTDRHTWVQTHGQVNRLTHKNINIRILSVLFTQGYKHMDKWTDRRTRVQTHGQVNGQTHKGKNTWTSVHSDRLVDRHLDKIQYIDSKKCILCTDTI